MVEYVLEPGLHMHRNASCVWKLHCAVGLYVTFLIRGMTHGRAL